MGEKIEMTRKELKRYKVIDHWIQGFITGGKAAELLGLNDRQVCRLKKRVLEEGETGIIHKKQRAQTRTCPFLTRRAK